LYKKKIDKRRVAVLALAMLTSLSSKGIFFIMEFVLMFYWFKSSNRGNLKKLLSFLFFSIIAIVAAGIGMKIIADKSDTGSFAMRIDDLSSALKTWKDHPIFGAGYGNTEEIVSHFRYHLRPNNGLSMGVAVLLAIGGLYLFSFYCSSYIASFLILRKTEYREKIIILGVILATNLIISNIQFGILFIFITSMGFALIVYSFTGGQVGRGEWFNGSAKYQEKLHL
jgi:O-antigen ligase